MERSCSTSWREWPAVDFNSWSSSPILIVSSPTMRTRSSSNSVGTRVVAFASAARGRRPGPAHGRDHCRRSFQRVLAHGADSVVVARRVEQFDDGERVVGRGVFTGDRGHHLLEAVGGGHQRLRAHR